MKAATFNLDCSLSFCSGHISSETLTVLLAHVVFVSMSQPANVFLIYFWLNICLHLLQRAPYCDTYRSKVHITEMCFWCSFDYASHSSFPLGCSIISHTWIWKWIHQSLIPIGWRLCPPSSFRIPLGLHQPQPMLKIVLGVRTRALKNYIVIGKMFVEYRSVSYQ